LELFIPISISPGSIEFDLNKKSLADILEPLVNQIKTNHQRVSFCLAMTAVLAASILAVVAITTPFAYASNGDSSETETEQELKQKNVGSGESTNDNCGQNLIDSAAAVLTCGTFTVAP
jgi:hypothetical protein